jgi:polysaccharide biosynthesis/export protein
MRTAIWSAILAALPVLCSGAPSQQATEPSPQAQQALPSTPPPVADSKIPAGGVPGATDPAKMVAQTPAAPATVDNTIYILGSDDQIFIRVWGDERLSGQYLIRPDGRISVPLLGEIVAAGKSPEAFGKEIENTLKEKGILMRPSVTVQVTNPLSKKYRINGEILKPGAFPLTNPIRVRDALVEAGGFKDFANKKDIKIFRGDKVFRFNWNDMLKGKHPEQNILLEPGDLIIVH